MRFRITALLSAVALTACAKGDTKPDSAKQAGAPAAGARKSDNTLRIAVIAKSSDNPVFLAARTGAEAAAKTLGDSNHVNVEIRWLTPPTEDGQVQAQRIQQAVNDGADAILISCSDAGSA